MRKVLGPLALSAALLGGCATVINPVTGEAERTVMDERQELAEGQKGHQQVLNDYGVYDNAKVQAYVNTLGQGLAQHSHRNTLAWHFTVLDSPEINAFALPGGYVYVTRGIMAYMESEADLAGVIGHEIGHVTARHGAQRATRQQAAGLGVLAASVLGAVLESQGVGGAARMASEVSQTAAAGYIASYGRDQESQADQLGAEYLARSHLDPHNMVDVITVLKNQERFADDTARAQGRTPGEHSNWLSSHPSNDQRLQDIERIASTYAGQYGDDGRARYLDAIQGMTFGDSRAQGLVRGRQFFHEPLGIALTAPEGWTIKNTAEAITLVNASSDAGLMVRLVPASAGSSHDEIIRTLIQPEQGRVERVSINGLSASHFVGTRRDAQGQAQKVDLTVVSGPANHTYLLIPAAKEAAALQRASAAMREAESSFRAMTAADHSAARPWFIKTVPYPKGGFAELAKRSPLSTRAEQQLRLINGVYAGGEPKQGQLVKVIE
ncbi:MAG: M48 family metalloprotease [Pseudomonadota bacterium]